MVNISTQNVLAENNIFKQGHGVSIGSETSGWVRNVVIRNSECHGTNTGVRIKSCRGRGGGVENVLYDGMTGSVGEAIQLTLDYCKSAPTNVTATPLIRNVTLRNINLTATSQYLTCEGLSDSPIQDITLENVWVSNKDKQDCGQCSGAVKGHVSPRPCFA